MNLVTYLNFGHLPANSRKEKLKQILFGHPNLYKRLQAPDIISAIDPREGESILDFGCGCGYLTFAIARFGSKAFGIDVNPYVNGIKIPEELKDNLFFKQAAGEALPFADSTFDKVLASEVLPMIKDPKKFLSEISRVLRPGGKLVIVNGLGFHTIKEAYENNSPKLSEFNKKYPGKVPNSYSEYVKKFQISAGTSVEEFITEQQILDMLGNANFKVEKKSYSPSKKAGDSMAWSQFELFLSTGNIVREDGFLKDFLKLSLLSLIDSEKYQGGLIVKATKA